MDKLQEFAAAKPVNEEVRDKSKEDAAPHNSFSHLSSWFFVFLGFTYATGFVIVSTYLGSFGVQDATGDILRLKYLQVGFYFLFFLGSLVVMTFALRRAYVGYKPLRNDNY